jgi:hypothetical protein
VDKQLKNTQDMVFKKIWNRIKEETELKLLKQLAILVETSERALSNKKSRGKFDAEWAIKIEKVYGISAYWILTGEGEKRRGAGTEDPYAVKLAEWMKLKSEEDNRAKAHIEMTVEEALPEFKEWLKNKKYGIKK